MHSDQKSTTMESKKVKISVTEIKKEQVDIEKLNDAATEMMNEPMCLENYQEITAEIKNEQVDSCDGYEEFLTESEISDDNDYVSKIINEKLTLDQKSKYVEENKLITEHYMPVKCDICEELISDFYHMKKHFLKKHDQSGYVVCCKRKFYERIRLVDHLHLHLNPNHFKCNYCGKAMSERYTLKRHMLEHLGIDNKYYQCEMCGISFKKEYMLQIHKTIHLPEGERRIPCSDCTEIYDSFYPLLQHFKDVHQKNFNKTCYVCGKYTFSGRDFETHINKHEGRPNAKIYCDVCGLGLETENGLRRHKRNQHPAEGKKEFPCSYCPKISSTYDSNRRHINAVHKTGYAHKCEICERLFKRKSQLKEHMAEHTGTPLYSCSWCPSTFYTYRKMDIHRKKFHPKEWEEVKLQKQKQKDYKPLNANIF